MDFDDQLKPSTLRGAIKIGLSGRMDNIIQNLEKTILEYLELELQEYKGQMYGVTGQTAIFRVDGAADLVNRIKKRLEKANKEEAL